MDVSLTGNMALKRWVMNEAPWRTASSPWTKLAMEWPEHSTLHWGQLFTPQHSTEGNHTWTFCTQHSTLDIQTWTLNTHLQAVIPEHSILSTRLWTVSREHLFVNTQHSTVHVNSHTWTLSWDHSLTHQHSLLNCEQSKTPKTSVLSISSHSVDLNIKLSNANSYSVIRMTLQSFLLLCYTACTQ